MSPYFSRETTGFTYLWTKVVERVPRCRQDNPQQPRTALWLRDAAYDKLNSRDIYFVFLAERRKIYLRPGKVNPSSALEHRAERTMKAIGGRRTR